MSFALCAASLELSAALREGREVPNGSGLG